jgi:hypothetical protein
MEGSETEPNIIVKPRLELNLDVFAYFFPFRYVADPSRHTLEIHISILVVHNSHARGAEENKLIVFDGNAPTFCAVFRRFSMARN